MNKLVFKHVQAVALKTLPQVNAKIAQAIVWLAPPWKFALIVSPINICCITMIAFVKVSFFSLQRRKRVLLTAEE